jgi:hypothetical protein
MRPLHLFSRWGHRSNFAAPSSLRVEVCPPSLRHAPESAWNRLMFWLMAPAPQDSAPPLNRLPGVRAEFIACLADVHHEQVEALRGRVHAARSLRELWHLRTEVFHLVALDHSQHEAEARLTDLNRHFPTRAPRSGFAPLGAL